MLTDYIDGLCRVLLQVIQLKIQIPVFNIPADGFPGAHPDSLLSGEKTIRAEITCHNITDSIVLRLKKHAI